MKYTNNIGISIVKENKSKQLSDLSSNYVEDWYKLIEDSWNYDSIWFRSVVQVWQDLTYNEMTFHRLFGYTTSEKEVNRTFEVYVFTVLNNAKYPEYSDEYSARKDPLRDELINLIVKQTGFKKTQVERILKQLYWDVAQGVLKDDDVLHPRGSNLFPDEYKNGAANIVGNYAGLVVDTAGNVLQATGNVLKSTSDLALNISKYLPYILIIGGAGVGYFMLKKQGII